MSEPKKAIQAVVILVIFAFGSKPLGFLREMLIASRYGSGFETDTFFIALTATTLLTSLLTKAINTTTIPILSEVGEREGKEGKKCHTNNLLNIIIFLSLGLMVLGWFLSPYIIKVLAHGFEGDQFNLAVNLMKIGLPIIVISGIKGVFRGYLHSESKFTESAATNLPYNFVFIFYLLFLSNIFSIHGLMVVAVLAVGSQLLVQCFALKSTGYRYSFIVNFEDTYIKKIVYMVPPILLIVAVNDLNKIIDRSLASTLVEGSISALNYGSKLKELVLGVFITAIATVLFPMLAKEANKDTYRGLKEVMGHGINIILLITIPSSIGLMVLSRPLVSLAFERGAFDSVATSMTTGSLIFYSLGLVGMALKTFLNKVYFALQDTKTPMVIGVIAVLINIVLNLILIRYMAHTGLALATSLSATMASAFSLYGLRKKIGSLEIKKITKCGLKSLIASLIMGAIAYILHSFLAGKLGDGTLGSLTALISTVSCSAILYLLLLYIFEVEEIHWLINLSKYYIRKYLK